MRVRGEGFFASTDTLPYQPPSVLLGQKTEHSCVSACCRMLLIGQFPNLIDNHHYSESFLRGALGTDEDGSIISLVPDVLRDFGMRKQYVCHKDLTIDELIASVAANPAIAIMRDANKNGLHALIVDRIEDKFVAIRDPLPEEIGSAYRISLRLFLPSWLERGSRGGMAVLVLE